MERLIVAFSLGLLLLVGGCVNPELPAGGYFICSQQHPDCPDGYTCKGGRCVKEGTTLDSSKDAPADASLDSNKDSKPGADSKPVKDGTPGADSKPVKDSTPWPDSKPVKDSTPWPDSKPVKDSTPWPDSKPVQDSKPWPDLKPVKDSKPWPDTKPAADSKPWPDLKPTTDSTPWPDQGTTGPVVTLKIPAAGITSYYGAVSFYFSVTSSVKVLTCELRANNILRGSKSNPSGWDHIEWKEIPDGVYTWDVQCKDQNGKWGYSNEKRSFTSKSVMLSACKISGWTQAYKYKLTKDIVKISGDCFKIDKANILFNGNNKSIISTRVKDVLYDRSTSEPFTVLHNNHFSGGKLWAPGWILPLAGLTSFGTPTAADFDGDGDLDLITPHYPNPLRVWTNSGSGKFGSAAAYTTKTKSFDTSRVLDFDQDGNLDFVAANDGSYEAFFRGSGTTTTFSGNWSAAMGKYTHNLDVADFSGNAKVDVLFGSNHYLTADDRRHMGMNQLSSSGTGGFAAGWTSPATYGAHGQGPAYVADFDHDNEWDMLLPRHVGASDQATVVQINQGSGKSFSSQTWSSTYPAGALDIDQDGKTDMVQYGLDSITKKRKYFKVYRGNGDGTFSYASALTTFLPKPDGFVEFAEVTGDSYPDAIYAPADEAGALTVFANPGKGSGGFVQTWFDPQVGAVNSLALRDLNNDGLQDLFISRSYTKSLTMNRELAHLENKGKGGFAQQWAKNVQGGNAHRVYVLGDLDKGLSRGVQIAAAGIIVKNFKAIRGFSIGVEAIQPEGMIKEVVVEDPDLFGFYVNQAKYTSLYRVSVKHLHQGVGLGVIGSSSVTVNNSSFCDAGYSRNLTPVSAYCYKSTVTGSNNQVKINNGCSSLSWTSCK